MTSAASEERDPLGSTRALALPAELGPPGVVRLSGSGRRRLERGHPWVFADHVTQAEAEPGGLVAIEGPRGEALGFGLYSSESKIRVRLVSRVTTALGEGYWRGRVERAARARAALGLARADGACRLLAGDADGVPGLVVDHYAGVFVLQCGTQGADRLRGVVAGALAELGWPVRAVLERSDASVRRLEGLAPRVELLRGALPSALEVREGELRYEVDVLGGHKTGHYLDQRDNRRRAAERARGEAVLDLFCYDGLFGVRAALAGAESVLFVDQSEAALERAQRNAERNGVGGRVRSERADAMRDLRARPELERRFGLVIVDPPAFAKNKRELAGAERGYRELNRRALALVRDGGSLVSASCSHAMKPEHFVQVLAEAAHKSGRELLLDELAGASPDHPALLALPESAYLKCAFLRVRDA